MPNRLSRYWHLGVFTMSVTQLCRHLQLSLESQECSEPTSEVRARDMQKSGVLQPLSPADPGGAGRAGERLAVPWNRASKQTGCVLPTSGSKSTQPGGLRFGKPSYTFFSTTQVEQTYNRSCSLSEIFLITSLTEPFLSVVFKCAKAKQVLYCIELMSGF